MPTPTYTPLANLTLSSSAASVTFSSISQAYRDLVLVVQATPVNNNVGLNFRLNGYTSSYPSVAMVGDGSAAASYTGTYGQITFGSALASPNTAATQGIANIMDYSATDKHKTVLLRANIPTGTYPGTTAEAYRYPETTAVSSLVVFAGSGNLSAGSTFALYGIAA